MDNEKIDIVMNKLNDIKSASLDYSAETIYKQIELYCDTMEDSYKKYITKSNYSLIKRLFQVN